MAYRVLELNCPGCNATLTPGVRSCPFCGRPIVIVADPEGEPCDPDSYLRASVKLLGGKKPFLAKHSDIDRIDAYMKAALKMEHSGILLYFWAYVKYDFYERKFLRTEPDYRSLLREAREAGVTEKEIEALFAMLELKRPAGW